MWRGHGSGASLWSVADAACWHVPRRGASRLVWWLDVVIAGSDGSELRRSSPLVSRLGA